MKGLLIFWGLILASLGFAQKLDVEGSIKIANTEEAAEPGTIRWTGTDFEGWNGSKWSSLTLEKAFNSEAPDDFEISSIVLLDSVQSYTVPFGTNLYISSWGLIPDPVHPDSTWATDRTFEIDGISFSGLLKALGDHYYIAIGEGMEIASKNFININGYLTPKKAEFLVHDLKVAPYTVPSGKTLFLTTYLFAYPAATLIDGVPFYNITIVYSGQTLSFNGSFGGVFIGYLK